MGDVNPQESERIPLKPREIAYAITRGNSCLAGADPDDMAFEKTDEPLYGFLPVILLRICLRTAVLYDDICRCGLQCCFCLVDCRHSV